LSGGWGQTRHWIKQWEKNNKKNIDEAPDWHDSGYICPYGAEIIVENDLPLRFLLQFTNVLTIIDFLTK
jgi:hypothetical protein